MVPGPNVGAGGLMQEIFLFIKDVGCNPIKIQLNFKPNFKNSNKK